jgi:hypothetical protein
MKARSSLINLSILFLTCIFLLIFAELFLKYFVHISECPLVTFNTTDNIINFDTNGPRQGTFSCGPLAEKEGQWRINNLGWNSEIDYFTKKRNKPLIAIIGDSFIEAFQVDVSKSIAGRLRAKLAGKVDVYSFGISGAALSEYLQISRYVRKYFNPDILVINVVHNDFDESLVSEKNFIGQLYVKIINHQVIEAPIIPFVPLLQRQDVYHRVKAFLVIHSSLFRYLLFNCHLDERIRQWEKVFNRHEVKYNANINVDKVKAGTGEIEIAIDYIIKTFKNENEGKKIIFMIDAPRRDIYLHKLNESNIFWMNILLKKICKKYNVGFIDLTKSFNDDYARHHRPFNETYDYHWNAYGHEMAAKALLTYLESYVGLMPGNMQITQERSNNARLTIDLRQ